MTVEKGDKLYLLLHGGGLTSSEKVVVEEVSIETNEFWVTGLDGAFDMEEWEYLEYTMPGWSYELKTEEDAKIRGLPDEED